MLELPGQPIGDEDLELWLAMRGVARAVRAQTGETHNARKALKPRKAQKGKDKPGLCQTQNAVTAASQFHVILTS